MTAHRESTLGVHLVLLLTMAVWGVNLSVVKLLTGVLDGMSVAVARMVVAAVTLSLLVWPWRPRQPAPGARTLLGLALCALLMVYANQLLFVFGIVRTSATNAAIVMGLGPLVSSLLASALLRERLGVRRLVGIAIGFAGVTLVVVDRPGAAVGGHWTGDLMILAGVTCFAAGGALVQRLSRGLPALEISWRVHLIGAVMLLLHAALDDAPQWAGLRAAGAFHWTLILGSAVGATALAAVAWNRAIGRIGVARTSLWQYGVPVFALAFAALALGEPLTAMHGLGLVAVLAGSMLAMRGASADAAAPAVVAPGAGRDRPRG